MTRRRRGNREGSVQWRENEGRWRGELKLAGKRQYFYGHTRQAVLDEIEKARKVHDLGLPVGAGREALSQFLARWLEDCVRPRSRPRTHRLYRQQVEAHIIPAIGEIALDKLTPQVIQEQLIAAKMQQGLAPRTVLHIRSVLRSALTQAEKWLLIPRNVVKLTEPPRKKKAEIRVFTPEQSQTFIGACKETASVRSSVSCWPSAYGWAKGWV